MVGENRDPQRKKMLEELFRKVDGFTEEEYAEIKNVILN